MRFGKRLGRLEQQLLGGKGGCRACRDRRGRAVLIEIQRMPDGTVLPSEPYPEPCRCCGKVPEQIIEVRVTVVASRDELQ